MRAEVINNWKDLFSIQSSWNSLLEQSSANSIFLTWEWISCWGEATGFSAKPFVIIVKNNSNGIIGIAPFYFGKFIFIKMLSISVLRTLGDYPTGSEYPGWIARPLEESSVFEAIASCLLRYKKNWDCVWIPNLAGWNKTHIPIIEAGKKAGFSYHIRPRNFSAMLLPNTFEAYFSSFSQNRRSQLRRQSKKILSTQHVSIVRCNTEEELPLFLNALFSLNSIRWAYKGVKGTFERKPNEAMFYNFFCKTALKKGWLLLAGLKVNDEFKAIQIGYVYMETFHQMQEGFDPEWKNGAGNVLRQEIIKVCIKDGVRVFDFLGEMTEHKRRWQAAKRIGYDLILVNSTIKNMILFFMEIWPSGKYLKPVHLISQLKQG